MPSRETTAIIKYLDDSGLPHRVTGILGTWKSAKDPCSPHNTGSAHCDEGTDGKGLAVDVGGRQPGTSLVSIEEMGAVHAALMKVSGHLSELIHNGPGITTAVRNGRVVDGLKAFGATTWAAHKNHLHVAVPRGTFLEWPTEEVQPMFDPPLSVTAWRRFQYDGLDGVVAVAPDGAIYCEVDGMFRGGANGQLFFIGRQAANIVHPDTHEATDGKRYVILSSKNERYAFPL